MLLAKMRRALRDLEEITPYFKALSEKIGELFHYIPQTKNRYFSVSIPKEQPHRTHGILLITADKGLAGAYNQEAIRVCEEYMSFEIKGTPDTVVTVRIDSNFFRTPNGEQRKLSLVLEDTDGN